MCSLTTSWGAVPSKGRIYPQRHLQNTCTHVTHLLARPNLLPSTAASAPRCPVQYWARLVEEAQAPNPLSSRDGRLLKIVPPERRLAPEQLQAHLEAALKELQGEGRDLMCEAWAQGEE